MAAVHLPVVLLFLSSSVFGAAGAAGAAESFFHQDVFAGFAVTETNAFEPSSTSLVNFSNR